MNIREATREDFEQIWPIFHEIAAAGETYAYPPDITKEEALKLWIDAPRKTCEENGQILGVLHQDEQFGPGDHVCNCGYMASSAARDGDSRPCASTQEVARRWPQAMQFNFVASSNEGAVRLWQKLGFTVGRLPRRFATLPRVMWMRWSCTSGWRIDNTVQMTPSASPEVLNSPAYQLYALKLQTR